MELLKESLSTQSNVYDNESHEEEDEESEDEEDKDATAKSEDAKQLPKDFDELPIELLSLTDRYVRLVDYEV